LIAALRTDDDFYLEDGDGDVGSKLEDVED